MQKLHQIFMKIFARNVCQPTKELMDFCEAVQLRCTDVFGWTLFICNLLHEIRAIIMVKVTSKLECPWFVSHFFIVFLLNVQFMMQTGRYIAM